jgi:hypothetical protein
MDNDSKEGLILDSSCHKDDREFSVLAHIENNIPIDLGLLTKV